MKTISILVQIPEALYQETKKIPIKGKKSQAHLLKLIAVTLYQLYTNDVGPSKFYKKLSNTYIQNYITTHNFYVKYFLPYLQGDFLINTQALCWEKIFQTSGIFTPKSIRNPSQKPSPKHYRINPKFLVGPGNPHLVEIEVGSLNEQFPEVIRHFEYSTSKLSLKESRLIIESYIERRAALVSISGMNEFSGYFQRNCDEWDTLSTSSTQLPKKINLVENKKNYIDIDLIKEMVFNKRIEENNPNIMLIHSRDKKNKDRFQIVDYMVFLEEQQRDLIIRLNLFLNNVEKGAWMPNISNVNGRLNHLLSYSNKFVVNYFELDGETIASLDLKSSQPTILANLLSNNALFKTSILESKYAKLTEMFDVVKDVFFPNDNSTWLEAFISEDPYLNLAQEENKLQNDEEGKVTRDEVKRMMMKFLFTEPRVRCEIRDSFKVCYPTYFNRIEKVKNVFKERLMSSKKQLPIFLQLVEAHIFVEIVYSEISKAAIPAITKHDCILFPASREKEIRLIVESCFAKIGFRGKMVLEKQKAPIKFNEWPYNYQPFNEPLFI